MWCHDGCAKASGWYRLLDGDLRELGPLEAGLRKNGVEGQGRGVLFVLEAVAGYLQPQEAQALLRWGFECRGPSYSGSCGMPRSLGWKDDKIRAKRWCTSFVHLTILTPPPPLSFALTRWLPSAFPCSSAVLLDTLTKPTSSLGQHVAGAFHSRGCPLLGLSGWDTPLKAAGDLTSWGFRHVWALDLMKAVDGVVGVEEIERVQGLEPFDEYAALEAFAR